MLLSILTPTLNCSQTIDETLRSVIDLESKFPGQIEHLIGDGESSDGTLEKLWKYRESYGWAQIDVLPGDNIPATLNKLIRKSTGKMIAVLNGDDYYEVEAMSWFLEKVDAEESCETIFCADINLITIDGDHVGVRFCSLDEICNYMSVNHPGMIVPRLIFQKFGYFNSESRYNYDYAWTWKMQRAGVGFKHYQRPVATLRSGGISERAAYKAATEIALIKFRSGAIWSSLRNYILFIAKYYAKRVLPDPILWPIIKRYRSIFNSTDPVDFK